MCVRQESNLHAQSRAPESESGTSPSSVTDTRHHEVRSAGVEPARPLWAPGFEPGASTIVPPRARMPPLCSFQSSDETALFAVGAAMHSAKECVAVDDVATQNVSCKQRISAESVVPQDN